MNHDHKGFTLIELMLAMSFISVLLLAIAMTVIQISNIYNRGLTLKEVNQAGRSLASELQRSVAASPSFSIDTTQVGTKYIQSDFGGRLCLGQYSYIWNYGKTLAGNPAIGFSNVYTSGSTEKIRFVKVPDSTGNYCSASNLAIDPLGAVELLDIGDRDLAVHSFAISTQITASNSKTLQSLYYMSFVIGTNDQAALEPTATTCKPPNAIASDLNYCSVNQFDIVAHAGNAVQ
ncbi:prepilin-type N-terminal cleavage/methylation domain-containing protein [Candidatus Saccharibacteria bacterium]|nr:prepilin-type N-terminal cleavage/methylation domain-containing protein [Candidatus Saccharibacteria bacterium]